MKIVIFGLTISSSWGNGHATLWRGLCKHLAHLGHTVVFYERDVPYYAGARDFNELPGGQLRLFSDWDETRSFARRDVGDADVAIVTSYCPDAIAATDLIMSERRAVPVFYDLDTPITLARLMEGGSVPYISPRGLRDFALVLSFTGGPRVAHEFRDRLGARDIRPLYGHVDVDIHRPVPPRPHYRADLSYLGTYSEDRQRGLEALFVEPARARQDLRFLIGGAQYPDDFPWSPNIYFVRHLPPSEHAPFFASSRLTLNVTRKAMAEMGWCPSGRLFEAAACGVPLLSDDWPGIEEFFAPGREILIARDAQDTLTALAMPSAELQSIARCAYERTMDQHTSDKRARELVSLLEQAASSGTHRQQSEEA
ncbi:glycosyltransferase [Bradyrhizobium sp. 160]|uniref:CgeB family protein n=1 Tax=unclassified Bradyrhizobium TaxID=2631580 RepID=UPI001FFBBA1D|nr:glycosyltransferase [Bradyrhizobium sp. 179]MCK1623074.1 glycosyltransferase [Bradyrhizobium sp. 160]